jgi:hypothetical protein
MIRRVLKDIRETWPYWAGLIALLLVPITTGWISICVESVDRRLDNFLPPRPSLSPKEIGKACDDLRRSLKTVLPYFALIHYLAFLLISVSLFGAEFKHQTMARLLAQPVSRLRIWFEKSLAFLVIVLIVLVSGWFICGRSVPGLARIYQTMALKQGLFVGPWYPVTSWVLCLLSVAALALANGTLASLFLRQTHTAFWVALVLPVVVFLLLTAADTLIVKAVFGVSVADWFQDQTLFGFALGDWQPGQTFSKYERFPIDFFLSDAAGALWFALVYPLAWLKFKTLEV